MALWISDTGERFDDGLAYEPGEDGFSRDLAARHFGKTGFNYAGTPNWHLRIEAEQKAESDARKAKEEADAAAAQEQATKDAHAREQAEQDAAMAAQQAAAKERIAQLIDPEGYAKAQAIAAIDAEHDALAAFASKGEAAQLDAVKDERLAALG